MSEKCNICGKGTSEHEYGLFCCPFCGGPASLVRPIRAASSGDSMKRLGWRGEFIASCFSSACPGHHEHSGYNFNEVAAAWNRRADTDGLREGELYRQAKGDQ